MSKDSPWTVCKSSSRDMEYYHNSQTDEKYWKEPGLPEGWGCDRTSTPKFINIHTKVVVRSVKDVQRYHKQNANKSSQGNTTTSTSAIKSDTRRKRSRSRERPEDRYVRSRRPRSRSRSRSPRGNRRRSSSSSARRSRSRSRYGLAFTLLMFGVLRCSTEKAKKR